MCGGAADAARLLITEECRTLVGWKEDRSSTYQKDRKPKPQGRHCKHIDTIRPIAARAWCGTVGWASSERSSTEQGNNGHIRSTSFHGHRRGRELHEITRSTMIRFARYLGIVTTNA